MRTAMIILGGFVLLGLCVLIGRLIGGANTQSIVTAAKVFLPIWLAGALYNGLTLIAAFRRCTMG